MSEYMDWFYEEMRAVREGRVDPLEVPLRMMEHFGGSRIGYVQKPPRIDSNQLRELLNSGVPVRTAYRKIRGR